MIISDLINPHEEDIAAAIGFKIPQTLILDLDDQIPEPSILNKYIIVFRHHISEGIHSFYVLAVNGDMYLGIKNKKSGKKITLSMLLRKSLSLNTLNKLTDILIQNTSATLTTAFMWYILARIENLEDKINNK